MEGDTSLGLLRKQIEAAFDVHSSEVFADLSEESFEDLIDLYWYLENVEPRTFGEALVEVIDRWERNGGHEAGIRAVVSIGDYLVGLYPEPADLPFEFSDAQVNVFKQFIVVAAARPEYRRQRMVQTTKDVLLDPGLR